MTNEWLCSECRWPVSAERSSCSGCGTERGLDEPAPVVPLVGRRLFFDRVLPYAVIGFLVGGLAGGSVGALAIRIIVDPRGSPATAGAGVLLVLVMMITAPTGAAIGIGRAMWVTRAERAGQTPDRSGWNKALIVGSVLLFFLPALGGTSNDGRVRRLSDWAGLGEIENARQVLDQGVDPNAMWLFIPPIHMAAVDGDMEMINLLYEYGADPTLLSEEGDTALVSVAIGTGDVETAEWFLDHGVDPCVDVSEQVQQQYGVKTLRALAVVRGNREMSNFLVAQSGCQ